MLAAATVALAGLARAAWPGARSDAEVGHYAFLAHIEEPGRLGVLNLSGTPLGNFALPPVDAAGMFPASFNGQPNLARTVSRDGTRLLLNDNTVLDERGHVLGRISPQTGFGGALWADDSSLCEITVPAYRPMAPALGSARLQAVGLSAPTRFLATVGVIDATHTVTVLACDAATDRVVTAQIDLGTAPPQPHTPHVISVTVSRWSDGALVAHVPFAIAPERVVASPDGRSLAVEIHDPSAPPLTRVRQLGGAGATRTIEAFVPVAFSAGATRLVGYRADGSGVEHPAVVLRLDGQAVSAVWQSNSPLGAVTAVADPGSERLLVAGSSPQGGDVFLIEPDGTSRELVTGFDEVLGDGPPPEG